MASIFILYTLISRFHTLVLSGNLNERGADWMYLL
jgi:hypothetical protein